MDVRQIRRKIGTSTSVELEFFCRRCKGHFSRTVPVAALHRATCRCGSDNILVYAISGEMSAPLRAGS
jgi:hypothetical protein